MSQLSLGAANYRAARDLLIQHREDYEAALKAFAWPEAPEFNWALDHFDPMALGNEAPALTIVDDSGEVETRSFDALRVASNQAANFLLRQGVRRGDRILVMLPNRIELWELMLAAIKIGAVLSPATTILSTADLRDRVERGRMKAVVVDASHVGQFDDIANECVRIVVGGQADGWASYDQAASESSEARIEGTTRANDPCVLYFTSGTTSKPKMVQHSHRSYPVGHLSTLYWIGLKPGDVHFNISSPGWAKHAWSCFFAPWTVGAQVFVYNQGRFDARKTLQIITEHKVTTLCAPPTAWRALILEDLSSFKTSLRELVSAGEPLNPEVIQRVEKSWNLLIREGYGQTESTAMLGNPPGQPIRAGSMGRPLPGYQIEVLDTEGKRGSEGEVSVLLDPRPAGLMSGYAGDEEKTRRALGGSHYGSGDVASIDDQGYFWFVGRTDDVFKSSDYRISPFELESALLEHEDVVEAAVVESPDPKKLCVPKACIVLKDGVEASRDTAHAIFEFSLQRLAPYQKIRIIEFGPLPKTVSGKIRRAELRTTEAKRRNAGEREDNEFFDSDFDDLSMARR